MKFKTKLRILEIMIKLESTKTRLKKAKKTRESIYTIKVIENAISRWEEKLMELFNA